MDEIITNSAATDTIPEAAESAEQNAGTETGEVGAPQSQSAQGAEGSETPPAAEQQVEPFLQIQYNHTERGLSREEATNLAQLGLKLKDSGVDLSRVKDSGIFELANNGIDIKTVKPIFNQLDYLAAQRGCSIEKLVSDMLASDEASYRDELSERFGNDENAIENFMKLYRDGQKEKHSKVVQDRLEAAERLKTEKQATLENRLGDEFIELKKEFPEVADFKDLPKSVKDEAATTGRDLLSCYLRHIHTENKKIDAAKAAQEAASKASTGAVNSDKSKDDSIIESLMRGIWNN